MEAAATTTAAVTRAGPPRVSAPARRDQLELVGTGGRLVVPHPWLCRVGAVELETGRHTQRLPADPDGAFGLTGEQADAYRIEFDIVRISGAAGDMTAPGRPGSGSRQSFN